MSVNDITAPYQAGSAYASFLLGGVDHGDIAPPADTHLGGHAIGLYAQDTWKITRKLTLTYGLRYDYQTYLREEHGRIANFSASAFNPTVGRQGAVAFEGYGPNHLQAVCHVRGSGAGAVAFEGYGPNHCNCNYSGIYPYALGPRLGVAYQITPKTVLRAGGAISYGQTAENADFSYSIGSITGFATATPDDPVFTMAQGIPANLHSTFPNFNPGQYPTPGELNAPFFAIAPGAGRPARIFQWSIGLQRELSNSIIVEANYVGNRGAWEQADPAFNILPMSTLQHYGLSLTGNGATLLAQPISSPAVQAAGFGLPYAGFPSNASLAQSLLPFPQFQGALNPMWAPLGSSWYNALQTRVTKRFSHGLQLSAQFAYSKMMAIGAGSSEAFDQGFVANGAGNQPYGDPYNYNLNTRRAYYKAACRFSDWCESKGVLDLASVKLPHIASYIEMLGLAESDGAALSKLSVKQHLAAPRMLFDWLVVGHVLEVNPAHAVRGPKYSQKKGKTPVLDRDEARALIAVIDTSSLTGLRDRALIGIMIYTFARVGAGLQMNVGDYFTQRRRGWVRLNEKSGKEHEAPCHHKLEVYLDEYIGAARIAADKDGPLFRTTGRSTGTQHRMTQQDAYRMVERHAKRAGLKAKIGNHTLRATGITDYLKSDSSLAEACKMENHADTRTTQLYDPRSDTASLNEDEKVGI